MGAFLVATLVIVILVFIMMTLLGFIAKTQRKAPELINFVNSNYFKKDLVLFLDSPIDSFGSEYEGMTMAEFVTLHFSELYTFAKKYDANADENKLALLTDNEKVLYAFFERSSQLAVDFCSKYKKVNSCNLELSTYENNKLQTITFPKKSFIARLFPGLDIKTGNSVIPNTLAEVNFYGPDGSVYTLRSKLSEPMSKIDIENILGESK